MKLSGNIALSILALGMAMGMGSAAEPGATTTATNPPIKQIGPTTFELGKVQFDKLQKTVTFPAALNMNAGQLEYVVVTTTGKTHESLVRTEAQPFQIHLAMLLLGAKGAGTNSFPEDPAKEIPGEKVSIRISWKDPASGAEKSFPIEDLVLNQQAQVKATRGPWIYNGSRVFQGTFLAQEIGSIVSLMTDPDALINNPRQGHENDKIWGIIGEGLPPLNWPMQVTIKLQSGQSKESP